MSSRERNLLLILVVAFLTAFSQFSSLGLFFNEQGGDLLSSIDNTQLTAQVGGVTDENPRLFFTKARLNSISQNSDLRKTYGGFYVGKTPMNFSLTTLKESDKSYRALNLAINILVLDPSDPKRAELAEQVKQALFHINDGVWIPSGGGNVMKWDNTTDVHAWVPGGVLSEYAMAYDFLVGAGYLSGEDLIKARSRILLFTALEYKKLMATTYRSGVNNARIANMRLRSLSGIGMALLAIPDQVGVIPDPENIMKGQAVSLNSAEMLQSIVNDLLVYDHSMTSSSNSNKGTLYNFVTTEGVYTEGLGYISDSFDALLPFMLAYEHVTGQSLLRSGGLTDGRATRVFDSIVKMVMPNKLYPPFDAGFMHKNWFGFNILAKYSNFPGELMWYFKNVSSGSTNFIYSFLSDSSIAPRTPTFRTEFFPESGNAIFRDKWGSDATYMMFLAEHDANRSSHEDPDQTSFMIYAKEAFLAIDSGDGRFYSGGGYNGGYYGSNHNWINSAFGHSLVLVDSTFTPGTNVDYRTSQTHPKVYYSFTSVPDPAYLQNTYAGDGMDYAEARMKYSGVNVDITRSIIFPRHKYFIVRDNLRASNSHEYKWQIHFGSSPETVGTDRLDSNGNSFTWTMKNTKGSQSSLDVDFLKGPESYNIRNDGPTGYDPYKAVYNHTYIQALANRGDHQYLTLLYPRYTTDPKLTITELVPNKAWKVAGSFSGYDIIINQDTSETVTAGFISTDAKFLLASFESETGSSIPVEIFAKEGSQINLGSKTLSLSSDPNSVFHTKDTVDTSAPQNGSCGLTNNACIIGTSSDTEDSETDYLWSCNGLNGGTPASCTLSKDAPTPTPTPTPPPPVVPDPDPTPDPDEYIPDPVEPSPDPDPTPDPYTATPAPPTPTPTPLPPGVTPTPTPTPGNYITSTPTPRVNTNTNITPRPNTVSTGGTSVSTKLVPKPTINLSRGSTGPDVTLFQQAMVEENLLTQEQVTGIYDLPTENAVKAFQSKYDIVPPNDPSYGKVDARTVVVYLMLSVWHLVR